MVTTKTIPIIRDMSVAAVSRALWDSPIILFFLIKYAITVKIIIAAVPDNTADARNKMSSWTPNQIGGSAARVKSPPRLLFAPTAATAAIIPKLKAAPWLPEMRKAKRRNKHPDIMPYKVDNHHIFDVRLGNQGFSTLKAKSIKAVTVVTMARYTERLPKGRNGVTPYAWLIAAIRHNPVEVMAKKANDAVNIPQGTSRDIP